MLKDAQKLRLLLHFQGLQLDEFALLVSRIPLKTETVISFKLCTSEQIFFPQKGQDLTCEVNGKWKFPKHVCQEWLLTDILIKKIIR